MGEDPHTALTPIQLEFVALYASGHDIRQIAEMKFYSVRGVEQSLAAARQRVGVRNTVHLCALAAEAGVIRRSGDGFIPVQEERVVGA